MPDNSSKQEANDGEDRPVGTSNLSSQAKMLAADSARWPYLENLNSAQREAVTWKSKGGLQILAGPGSGAFVKERVTSAANEQRSKQHAN